MIIIRNFMKNFKKVWQPFLSIVAAIAVSAVISSCKDTDYELGGSFLPDNQDLTVGQVEFAGIKVGSTNEDDRIFTTRLYRTNRINAARHTYGSFGAETNSIFGTRRSGFFSQYVPINTLEYYDDDDDYQGFGYKPFIDSVVLYLSMADFSGDTTTTHTYNVYEVIDDSFLSNSADTTFSFDFNFAVDAVGALSSDPIFTFDFPDQTNGVYANAAYVRMNIVGDGQKLLDRMLLYEVDGVQHDEDLYDEDDTEDFLEAFKGLYIVPVEQDPTVGEGATYCIDLESSGFGFFARNLEPEDEALIADTVGMTFIFREDAIWEDGLVSISTVSRNYSTGTLDENTFVTDTSKPDGVQTSTIYVEAMGGVVTVMTLEKALFEELDRVIEEGDDNYTSMFFSVARLSLYVDGAEYDRPLTLVDLADIDKLNKLPMRMGLFVNYNTFVDSDLETLMETVVDYDFYTEAATYYTSDFDGTFNRSLGCYEMNIPLQMQEIWTEYQDAKSAAGGDRDLIDWESQSWTRLYIAPVVTNFMSPRYSELQGPYDPSSNQSPMRFEITYTLLK